MEGEEWQQAARVGGDAASRERSAGVAMTSCVGERRTRLKQRLTRKFVFGRARHLPLQIRGLLSYAEPEEGHRLDT